MYDGLRQQYIHAVQGVVVKFNMDVDSLREGWSFIENGDPVHLQRASRNFFVFAGTFSSVWKFRTTIVKIGPYGEVVELCEDLTRHRSIERATSQEFYSRP